MERREFLLTLLTALASAGKVGAASGPGKKRPHVIFISIDTLRADHLGCYGYGRKTSPNIDSLAGQGVRFANAFAQSSWTLPSHMSMMTSQYPHVHAVENAKSSLNESAVTLAEILSEAGYRTAAFVSWIFVSQKYGFGQGFREFTELIPPERYIDSSTRFSFKAEEVTACVSRWLQQKHDQPVFLFVHYFDPHMNYEPPPPFDAAFDTDYQGEASGEFDWLRRYIKYVHAEADRQTISPRDLEHVKALYDGEIRYTDTHLKALLDAIDKSLGLDNCLLVLTSDHGEEFNEHGSMEGHQWTLYDEVLHVPLILRLPGGVHAGTVVQPVVQLIDPAPTILDVLGLPAAPSFQGRSLVGLVTGDYDPTENRLTFAENRRFNAKQSVRSSRYKLVHTDDIGVNARGVPVVPGYEMFDLEQDPAEQHNIYDGSHAAAIALAVHLHQWKASWPAGPAAGEPGPEVELSEEELERLRDIGYIQ